MPNTSGPDLRVLLLIDTATSRGAGIVDGIAAYADEQGLDWILRVQPHGRYERLRLPRGWSGPGVGVIARVTSLLLADELIASGLPAVDVSWYRFREGQIARASSDDRGSARLAAEHLLGLGFDHFAYCGNEHRRAYVDLVSQTFAETIAAAGKQCSIAPLDSEHPRPPEQQLSRLVSWLGALPKPVGVLAFDSYVATRILECCRLAGCDVPADVAVLSGEHDELACRISHPRLSSIDQAPQAIGYRAGELLDRLVRGQCRPGTSIEIPPAGVIARRSTDTVFADDPWIGQALQRIRRDACRHLTVTDVIKGLPMSRRLFERKFRETTGRTPADEIRRVRLERARYLLATTSQPVSRVALEAGFEYPAVMSRLFQREIGLSPGGYRRQYRG